MLLILLLWSVKKDKAVRTFYVSIYDIHVVNAIVNELLK